MRDPNGSNLQKIQMIKGWIENGKAMERVFDIAYSDGLIPDSSTGLCLENGAEVGIKTCNVSISNKGDPIIKVRWQNPNSQAGQSAFYYVRVLENPNCRWSTYDALRLGIEPLEGAPTVIPNSAIEVLGSVK